MDPLLLPSASFDADVRGCHVRRPDGYLGALSQDMQGYAVCAKPVSILKIQLPNACQHYDESSVYVDVSDFE